MIWNQISQAYTSSPSVSMSMLHGASLSVSISKVVQILLALCPV